MVESLNKDVKPGSELHARILDAVINRKNFSQQKMLDHVRRWGKIDDEMVVYIPQSAADKIRTNKRDVQGVMDYITLEVPYLFAIVSSMHTYITSVFLGRSPIYQVSARHGEGQDSVMAVEAVMDYQKAFASHSVYLYHWLWDGTKYGLGVIGEYWDQHTTRVARIVEREKTILGVLRTGKMEKIREVFEEVAFEGNRLYNIRPYDWFPDPRLPIYDFQNGEFCGRQVQQGLSTLECEQYTGRYLNIDLLSETKGDRNELAKYHGTSSANTGLEPAQSTVDRPLGTEASPWSIGVEGKDFVTVLEMVIRISPKQWGLGDTDRPEKWVFTVANESLVIGARPLGLYHDKFPYSVVETGFGSEEFIKPSTVDHIRPLAQTLSWLFNTHMYNVRKAINDVRVVDPSKIVMKDVQKPEPGGVIRLKPQFYGGDVRTAIMQLQASDVTMNHLRDSQVVEQFIQRVSGVVDNVMGLVAEGGRKTATEVRTASGFSVNRIKTTAEYYSALGFTDLVGRMISNTQQMMTMEKKFAIAGSTMADAQRFIQADPAAIAGAYDFVAVDGTLPIDRLAQANFWKELLMQLGRTPQLAMQWDLGAMLGHAMMLQGERNVNRFKVNVAQPGMAPGGTLPGNVIPIGGAGGQPGGGAAAAAGGTGSATTTL